LHAFWAVRTNGNWDKWPVLGPGVVRSEKPLWDGWLFCW